MNHQRIITTVTKIKLTNSKTNYLIETLIFNEKGKCINGSSILGSVDLLHTAYQKIKSNPGNMVHGVDDITLDRISKD
jgi:hypothetical protein